MELLAVFFVIDRLTVRFFSGRRWSQEPFSKSKMPFGGEIALPKSGWGYVVCFFPKTFPHRPQKGDLTFAYTIGAFFG